MRFYLILEYKHFTTRIISLCNETDMTVQKYLKNLLSTLCSLSPQLFWGIWNHIRPNEKKSVNVLFGSKDVSYNKVELETYNNKVACIYTCVY